MYFITKKNNNNKKKGSSLPNRTAGRCIRGPFVSLAIPVFSVLQPDCSAMATTCNHRVWKHFCSKCRFNRQLSYLLCVVPLGSQEEYEFLGFPGSKTQKITTTRHQPGKYWFPGSWGPERVGCPARKPIRRKGKIPNERKCLRSSSLLPAYQRSFTDLLEKEFIPVCSPHKGIVWILFDPWISNLGYEFS